MSNRTILLCAGGTGGHLFPAFALAEELKRRGYRIELATDTRGDRYGTGFPSEAIHSLSSATIRGKSPGALAQTGWTLARGVFQAYRLLVRIRPAAVVGFGGYPSFPPLVAASLRRIPSALHEQNAVLGRANRMLLGRVTAIATSFEQVRFLDANASAKVHFTGNPIRAAVLEQAERPYQTFSDAAHEKFNLLVFGGSQGARYFSETVPLALKKMPVALRHKLRVVQQCRSEDLAAVQRTYVDAGIDATCDTFFKDLPVRIADSHLVIGRSGASSVAELAAIGRPSILVPLPHALDNDQLQNATSLSNSGGAWCIEQSELTPDRLVEELSGLMKTPERLRAAAESAKAQGRPDAVLRLAKLVERLASGAGA